MQTLYFANKSVNTTLNLINFFTENMLINKYDLDLFGDEISETRNKALVTPLFSIFIHALDRWRNQ